MQFDYYEYQICGAYASAIINGDYSGLSDEEERQLNDFLASVPRNDGHWDGFDEEEDSCGFSRDDVSGLLGDCYKARYYFPLKAKT